MKTILIIFSIIIFVSVSVYFLSKVKIPVRVDPDQYNIEKCIKDNGYPITKHDFVDGYDNFVRCDK